MEPNTKLKVGPKDFFLQVAITICLYVSVGSVIRLVFGIIDYQFPDQLAYYADPYSSGIRFAIAALLIIYPLFFILARVEHSDLEKNPEKFSLWTHRWAGYLNIFLSGATIAITLITLINNFLGGELTIRFGLKALWTIVVAALVLAYYLSDIRKGIAFTNKARTIYISAGGVLALLAIIVGFFVMGSPATVRMYRLDDQRVNDLQSIQWQTISYYQQHAALPAALTDLENPTNGYPVPKDPEGKAYTYAATGKLSFRLCADFNLASRNQASRNASAVPAAYGVAPENWVHAAGAQCFDRTIDPAQYPLQPKTINM